MFERFLNDNSDYDKLLSEADDEIKELFDDTKVTTSSAAIETEPYTEKLIAGDVVQEFDSNQQTESMQITNSSPFLFPVVREDKLIRIKAFIKYGSPIIYRGGLPLPESEYGKIRYENNKFFVEEYQVTNTKYYTIKKLFVDLTTKEPLEQTIPFTRIRNKQYTTDRHPVIQFKIFLRRYDLVYADGIEEGKSVPKNALLMQDQNGKFYFENHPLISKGTYEHRKSDKRPVYAEGEKAGKLIPTPEEVQQDEKGNSYILEDNQKQPVITRNSLKLRKRRGKFPYDYHRPKPNHVHAKEMTSYLNEILHLPEQLVNAIQNGALPTTPNTFPSTPSSFWNEDYIGSLPLFPSSPKQDAVKKPEETMDDSNKTQGSKNTCKIM